MSKFEVTTANPPAEEPTMAQKWSSASRRWAKDIKIAYINNPAARRDIRVQFRGNRSAAMFGTLIFGMGALSLFLYWSVATKGLSPEQIQDSLLAFMGIVFGVLGLAVSLIAPALAATSILAEKQRKSLDLVFASPIKPSSYLLGKLIASYRFVWVFMALSLPFTALSVMMGGGSWWNVVESYFLLSIQALLFTSIGLYFSSLVERTLSAMFYTYIAVVGYLWVFGILGGQTLGQQAPFSGGAGSFFTSLVPFFVEFASGTYTPILGIAVPNSLLAAVAVLSGVKFILSCASGLLSPLRASERRSLRLQVVALVSLGEAFLGYHLNRDPSQITAALVATMAPLTLFVPFLACYGADGERRSQHSKLFSLTAMFGTAVSGALPYLYLLIGAASAALGLGIKLHGGKLGPAFFLAIAYSFAVWTFSWATARFASSFNIGVKAARTVQFLSFAAVGSLPLLVLVPLSMQFQGSGFYEDLWKWYPFSPFAGIYSPPQLIGFALTFLMSSLGLALWSEKNFRTRLEKKKLEKMAAEPVLSSTPTLHSLDLANQSVNNLTENSVRADA